MNTTFEGRRPNVIVRRRIANVASTAASRGARRLLLRLLVGPQWRLLLRFGCGLQRRAGGAVVGRLLVEHSLEKLGDRRLGSQHVFLDELGLV
eukprot:TRINITY_DN2722_c0_g1_i1.p1 TRINITY_DN2722_c0_g1~~TRINITY_DN2722_c0_g1_i1.p1  ORF type:complete len:105 (+),score=18.67 TRINITY_DN2722_c0_g1_i1:37-315(+)